MEGNKTISYSYGKTVLQKRLLWNMTQQELAELSGVTERTIRAIEAGKANPSLATITAISNVLNLELMIVNSDRFMTIEDVELKAAHPIAERFDSNNMQDGKATIFIGRRESFESFIDDIKQAYSTNDRRMLELISTHSMSKTRLDGLESVSSSERHGRTARWSIDALRLFIENLVSIDEKQAFQRLFPDLDDVWYEISPVDGRLSYEEFMTRLENLGSKYELAGSILKSMVDLRFFGTRSEKWLKSGHAACWLDESTTGNSSRKAIEGLCSDSKRKEEFLIDDDSVFSIDSVDVYPELMNAMFFIRGIDDMISMCKKEQYVSKSALLIDGAESVFCRDPFYSIYIDRAGLFRSLGIVPFIRVDNATNNFWLRSAINNRTTVMYASKLSSADAASLAHHLVNGSNEALTMMSDILMNLRPGVYLKFDSNRNFCFVDTNKKQEGGAAIWMS